MEGLGGGGALGLLAGDCARSEAQQGQRDLHQSGKSARFRPSRRDGVSLGSVHS